MSALAFLQTGGAEGPAGIAHTATLLALTCTLFPTAGTPARTRAATGPCAARAWTLPSRCPLCTRRRCESGRELRCSAANEALLKRPHEANGESNGTLSPSCRHIAAEAGDLDMLRLLLGKGALVDLRDASGSTPLHLALEMQVRCAPSCRGVGCLGAHWRGQATAPELMRCR